LKPYIFIENTTLYSVLVKFSDLVTNEFVQTYKHEPLPIKLEDLQPIGFEPVNNYLTHGNIIGVNVFFHYYHDVPIEDNNVAIHNDQDDAFCETFIDVYIVKVYNPKCHIYSQPHGCYQLKQYREPSQLLFCLFVLFIYSYY
jgi:hypothetical protein